MTPPPSSPPPARVALVTGASSGIGRHLALGLAAAGLAVGVLGRDGGRLAAVADEAAAAAGRDRVLVRTADVTDLPALRRAVAAVEGALGPVDLLVSAAGVIEAAEVPAWEADPDEWRRVVEVDLVGAFHAVRAAVPGMVARGGGRVLHLGSGSGVRDAPVYSAYGAASAGTARLTGALHAAGRDRGLRALELAPGVVRTPMTAAMAVHDDRSDDDWTDPADVVALALAFARGELDDWSGRVVRAGTDTPASLARAAAAGFGPRARTLGLLAYGPEDPLG